jgi:3-hydroxy-9,10-secoandrosta-1,3,5(10)-triene-9,17-dione monooxygenase reductase component
VPAQPARPSLTDPAFDQDRFRSVMGAFATGVVVVTAVDDGEPVGFTAQSFLSLSLEPPLIALAPGRTSTSWPRIRRAGTFCVNVLSEDQADLGRRFAVPGVDRFAGLEWVAGRTGAPVLPGSLAWVECDVELIHDAGDHELVIGRVRALGHRSGSPLVFYRGRFEGLRD